MNDYPKGTMELQVAKELAKRIEAAFPGINVVIERPRSEFQRGYALLLRCDDGRQGLCLIETAHYARGFLRFFGPAIER